MLKNERAVAAMQIIPLLPKEQDSALRGLYSVSPGDHNRLWQTSVSKSINFAPPVRNVIKTDGKRTPGQKKHAGNGVTVMSHATVCKCRRHINVQKK